MKNIKYTKTELKKLDKLAKEKGKIFNNANDAIEYINTLTEDKRPDNKNILRCIESLVLLYQDGSKTRQQVDKVFDQIYRFAHISNERCQNKHKDWVEEYFRIEKILLEY